MTGGITAVAKFVCGAAADSTRHVADLMLRESGAVRAKHKAPLIAAGCK